MLTVTLRDLQYRWRQFAIAVAGATVAFALTLLLTGISAGFRTEARTIVSSIHTSTWIVAHGVTGPFTSQAAVPAALADQLPHVEAHPIVILRQEARLPHEQPVTIDVIGHSIGRLGDPLWGHGNATARSGDAIVDVHLGAKKGSTVEIGPRRFRVVGFDSRRTFFGGIPTVYMSLADAQALAYGGRPLASAIVARPAPRSIPRGYAAVSNGAVSSDILRPLHDLIYSMDTIRVLMWIVAAVIIGAVTYLTTQERLRDFAVLKAVGTGSRSLAASLALEAIVAALLAAAIGVGLAQLLAPSFPVRLTLTLDNYLELPLIAAAVGVVASAAALRRAITVDPALAFAG